MKQCTRKPLKAQDIWETMEENDGLVHAVIRRQGGGDISYEEALWAGRIGLWYAIKGYDPKRGTAFSTYAWVAISRSIYRRAKELGRSPPLQWQETPAYWSVLDPAVTVEEDLVREVVLDLVGQLPERLRQVIIGRYGLGDSPPRTLQSLGDEMGITRERVRQLQQDALAWLRHPAHSSHLRQLLGRNTVADYRHALGKNAALRRSRRPKR